MKRLLKFVIEHLVKDTLTSAGNQIGEAIGKRIGQHIYDEPEPVKPGTGKETTSKPEGEDEPEEKEDPTS